MTIKSFKEKMNEKEISHHKKSSEQEEHEPSKTQPHSQPTQNLHTSKSQEKKDMYAITQITVTYVCNYMY